MNKFASLIALGLVNAQSGEDLLLEPVTEKLPVDENFYDIDLDYEDTDLALVE